MEFTKMDATAKCDICRLEIDDRINLGEIFKKSNLSVHYYCLLLSTHLPQNGKNGNSGILGFYVHDIKNEIKAATYRICFYCKQTNASIKCSSCNKYFHLKCGLDKNCLFQFHDEFKSFCHEHHNIKHDKIHSSSAPCYICKDTMGDYNPLTSITSNCCNLNVWVHRECLKKYALSAGYYLKCIWCGDENFRQQIRYLGIFVPDRDAEWEKVEKAYAELYVNLKKKCMATKCICPKGKDYKSKSWEIQSCIVCGAYFIHRLCRTDNKDTTEFQCTSCIANEKIIQNSKNNRSDSRTSCCSSNLDESFYMSKSQSNISFSSDLNETITSHASHCIISSDSELDNDDEEKNITKGNFQKKCMAINCSCPCGRTYKNDNWCIEDCKICNKFSIHKFCDPSNDNNANIEFICDTCKQTNSDKTPIISDNDKKNCSTFNDEIEKLSNQEEEKDENNKSSDLKMIFDKNTGVVKGFMKVSDFQELGEVIDMQNEQFIEKLIPVPEEFNPEVDEFLIKLDQELREKYNEQTTNEREDDIIVEKQDSDSDTSESEDLVEYFE